jgi:hypothetical protein
MIRDDIERIRLASGQSDTEKSIRWYQNQIRKLGLTAGRHLTLSASRNSNSVVIGNMYLFAYDPKYADRLPYYDVFPLVLPYQYTDNGFKGINLHYVPPVARVGILEALMDVSRIRNITDTTKLRMSWEVLSKASILPMVQPTLKQYIFSHIQSGLMKIDAPEWKIAALLPIENFQKKSRLGVFQKSRLRRT